MSRKAWAMLVVTAFLGVVVAATMLWAAEPPEAVEIYYESVIGQMKKGPVAFSHKKHSAEYGVTCAECHHKYEGGQNVWKEGDAVQKCGDCHQAEDTEAGGAKVMKLQNAFHKNCKDCHKDKGKGPFKKCEECHAAKK
ncbi:MAG: cytochrome c3 family protein [Thermodesulfobacteriota bacterium]